MKKIKKDGYNLHIIPNSDFKTVSIKIMIWNKLKEEDLTYRNMLLDVLLFSSEKYPSMKEMAMKKQDLYSLDLYFENYRRGKMIVSEICMSAIHDKYSEENNVKKSIDFLFDVIKNPNVKNNMFDKSSFDICKESLKSDLKTEKDNPDYVAYQNFKSMLGNKEIYSGSIYGNLKDLNKITRNNLYNYYKKFFANNNIDIVVLGDIDEKEIEKQITDNFVLKTKSITYESPLLSYKKNYSEKIKSYPFIGSRLIMSSSLNKLSKHEKIYELGIYNVILGSSPASKLFQNVREKHSYCYSISSSPSRLDDIFMIRSSISYKNFENTKIEVLKQIESMKKGEFSLKSIKEAKEFILNVIDEVNDSPWAIIDYYINHLYFGSDTIEKQKNEIKNVSKESIIKIANKINIDTVFLLKGDKDEKN